MTYRKTSKVDFSECTQLDYYWVVLDSNEEVVHLNIVKIIE